MSNVNAQSAQEQWRNRPADQCHSSLLELAKVTAHVADHSNGKVVPSRGLTADIDGGRLVVRGPSGAPAIPTHWAFGQLAARAGAPAGYLRDVPNELAVDCLNYGLHVARPVEDVGVLLYKNGGPAELHAVTGPNYGRIWNARIAEALVEAFGDGLTGKFRIPSLFVRGGIRREAVASTLADAKDTTIYSSDRDMWVMLASDNDPIEVKDRRDGQTGHLYQGHVFGNSDVGDKKFWQANFLFDDFCYNHLIWGFSELEEINIRHTASAPHRFLSEVVPQLKEIARTGKRLSAAVIATAQRAQIDDLDKFLSNRKFNRSQIAGVKAAYLSDEGSPLSDSATIWNAVVGLTAYARGKVYQDERVAIEREAGKILLAVA